MDFRSIEIAMLPTTHQSGSSVHPVESGVFTAGRTEGTHLPFEREGDRRRETVTEALAFAATRAWSRGTRS